MKEKSVTAKERLFGNLHIALTLARGLPDSATKEELTRYIERAISWEPCIRSDDPPEVGTQTY
jgi:hypothetical protein